eukprot:TRINITY_DN2962_c0_g1_i2.p4 TRINITY_DN2962_c0_g1~~TRINITY_DN2962_c0_g1_i2.p4  ORF type:complete len:109 (-),score=13.93 TRINITY_DN2962_c0_g1_i2:357-683(-)
MRRNSTAQTEHACKGRGGAWFGFGGQELTCKDSQLRTTVCVIWARLPEKNHVAAGVARAEGRRGDGGGGGVERTGVAWEGNTVCVEGEGDGEEFKQAIQQQREHGAWL